MIKFQLCMHSLTKLLKKRKRTHRRKPKRELIKNQKNHSMNDTCAFCLQNKTK